MRALVISRQKFQAPIEVFPAAMQAFADWRDRYRQHMESFSFFSAGGEAAPSSTRRTRRWPKCSWNTHGDRTARSS